MGLSWDLKDDAREGLAPSEGFESIGCCYYCGSRAQAEGPGCLLACSVFSVKNEARPDVGVRSCGQDRARGAQTATLGGPPSGETSCEPRSPGAPGACWAAPPHTALGAAPRTQGAEEAGWWTRAAGVREGARRTDKSDGTRVFGWTGREMRTKKMTFLEK